MDKVLRHFSLITRTIYKPEVMLVIFLSLLVAFLRSRNIALSDLAMAIAASILLVILLWRIPEYLALKRQGEDAVDAQARIDRESSARSAIGQLMAGMAAVVGIYFLWGQLEATNTTLKLTHQGQTVASFTQAVDQLEGDGTATRLGGIFALELIGQEPDQLLPVTQVLSARARGLSPWPRMSSATRQEADHEELAVIIEVLTGFVLRLAERGQHLDLHSIDMQGMSLAGKALVGTDFRGSNLANAKLSLSDLRTSDFRPLGTTPANLAGAEMIETNLSGSTLRCANLSGSSTSLVGARLLGSDLTGARMQQTNIADADLQGAVLVGTDLRQANLTRANLSGTVLQGTLLQGAILTDTQGLANEQLAAACIDATTILPQGIDPDIPTFGCGQRLSTECTETDATTGTPETRSAGGP